MEVCKVCKKGGFAIQLNIKNDIKHKHFYSLHDSRPIYLTSDTSVLVTTNTTVLLATDDPLSKHTVFGNAINDI